MQVRACQLPAEDVDLAARLATIRFLIADAASDGADVVVFPELAVTGYGAGDVIRDLAEGADGTTITELQGLADDHRVSVILGLAVKREDGVVNAAVVAQPGRPAHVYAKQHLYGEYEKALFVPGTQPSAIFEVAGKQAGVLVCFDVEFPERVRELAVAGAEIVFVPTALPAGEASRFIAESVVPVRAFENHIFVAYVNHSGADARFSYQGLSCIAAPDGTRIAVAPEKGFGILDATIDGADYAASVETNPYLAELQSFTSLRQPAITPLERDEDLWTR